MTVEPLHLADVQAMTGLDAAGSVDALLITGGFPEIVNSWRPGMSRIDFLRVAAANPLAPLLVAGELSLLGEFPEGARSRAILEAIGNGERSFSTIAAQAGRANALPAGTLNPLLNTLQDKRIVRGDLPLSTKPDTKNKRYRIADSYLRSGGVGPLLGGAAACGSGQCEFGGGVPCQVNVLNFLGLAAFGAGWFVGPMAGRGESLSSNSHRILLVSGVGGR
jgi:hypothetical protein